MQQPDPAIIFLPPLNSPVAMACPSACTDIEMGNTDTSRPSSYAPHHQFNQAVCAIVSGLGIRDKRCIFNAMRFGALTDDTFFPRYGITAGEFSLYQVGTATPRRSGKDAT